MVINVAQHPDVVNLTGDLVQVKEIHDLVVSKKLERTVKTGAK